MKPIRSLQNFSEPAQRGFTIFELLVALLLSTTIGVLVTQAIVFQSNVYLADIARVRIQQNLRGALDVIAMNVREAGEGLDHLFPAVLVSGGPTLTVRRKILHQVLTVCSPIAIHDDKIFITDAVAAGTECLPVNVAPSLTAWQTNRSANNGIVTIYIYDRVSKTGEFVDYVGDGSSGGNNYLAISRATQAYPANSTSAYVIEQYAFNLDLPSKTLQLKVNGSNTTKDVAYNSSQFLVSVTMQDGTVVSSLAPTDILTWKNIKELNVNLTGVDSWKGKTVTRSVSGKYFPRNVLSP